MCGDFDRQAKRGRAPRTLFAGSTLANAPKRSKYSKCCTSVYSSKTWCNPCANVRKSSRDSVLPRTRRASANTAHHCDTLRPFAPWLFVAEASSRHPGFAFSGAPPSYWEGGFLRGFCKNAGRFLFTSCQASQAYQAYRGYRARASSPSKALRAARSPPKAAQTLPEHCPPSARASPPKCARLRSS